MIGTLLNVGAVLLGGGAGLLLGERLPERIRVTVLQGIGLLTLFLGIKMGLATGNVLILMGSILVGGVLGELMDIQGRMDRFGDFLKGKLGGQRAGRFSEGFVTASLVFCIGPMTIMGSIQDGLTGDFQLLSIKSVLDGFASLAFTAAFGVGVLFAAVTVLVFQGAISLGARSLDGVLSAGLIDEMTATGGLMVLGLGLIILDVSHPRVANFLPALGIAPILKWIVVLTSG